MADKPQRRGGLQNVDPAVMEFMRGADTNPAALTAKQRRDRKRTRVMYDLDPEVKTAIEDIAKEQKTSASQAAALLLTWVAARYFQNNGIATELKEAFFDGHELARTPRFEWNIEPSEALVALLRERQR